MNNFQHFLTPEEAYELDRKTKGGRREPLAFYQSLARDDRVCEVCEVEKVWKLADSDM
jgi:hypothetical protein